MHLVDQIKAKAKADQASAEQVIIHEKISDLTMSVQSERMETDKWKSRFNSEQDAHKKTQS